MKIVKQLPQGSRSVSAGAVVLCAALCAGGLACQETGLQTVNDGGVPMGGAGGAVAVPQTFPVLGGQQVDILFMVDNSPSMAPLQAKLNAGFPTFIDTLNAQAGGPPDMHIAVISSDTGPGKFDLPNFGCNFGGRSRPISVSTARGCLHHFAVSSRSNLHSNGQRCPELHRGHRRRPQLHRDAGRPRVRLRRPAQVRSLGAGS